MEISTSDWSLCGARARISKGVDFICECFGESGFQACAWNVLSFLEFEVSFLRASVGYEVVRAIVVCRWREWLICKGFRAVVWM